MHGRVEERRGRRGLTSPGEEKSNETRKLVTAHGSVDFCEATPFYLFSRRVEGLYRRETDRDLRSACRCVTGFCFSPNEQGGGRGGALPDFLFCSLFPVQQTTSGIGHRVK